ncbi:hypothetical protein N7492_010216 [Penicillium capsulatum]|uniref:FAM192A/Fyv6 N-terminal domain-containing protein n=1 Tax=Penicillium capsulatum TaxID=69766 RepID=A0A9W9HP92_9EURO|nr:hypothetical protein N7492_010216 [Penicillium capsulatum]KAJ6112724.1 hypothetical protein N7512_008048 [Penicillium capsulatum]
MSSGFVSAGTTDQPVERDDEWLKVQQELEEERRRKAEIGQQNDGKSLYEVLQQNKMAKQEQFEEKIRLKNQFRALDEDEVDFLDSVLESTRAQEAAVKKDTADQLEVFRKQREEAEKALLGPTSSDVTPVEEEEWSIPARKRRRDKGKDLLLPGKKRKASAAETEKTSLHQEPATSKSYKDTTQDTNPQPADTKPQDAAKAIPAGQSSNTTDKDQADAKQPAKPAPVALGLAAYGSDSDSE